LDKLEFVYREPSTFLIRDKGGIATPNAFNQTTNMPKQVYAAMIEFVGEASTAVSLGLAIGTFIAATAGKLSLQKLWGNINALQLIVHLPLINLLYPVHLQALFDRLISVVVFDVLEIFDEFELQTLPEFTPTEPLNNNCDAVGYGSTNTMDNLGSINYLIALLLVRIVIFALQRMRCCRHERLANIMIDKQSLANEVLRFVLETFFDLFLIVLLTFAPGKDKQGVFYLEEWNTADKFSVVVHWFLIVVLAAFWVLLVYATLCLVKPIRSLKFHLHNQIVLGILKQVDLSK